MRRVNDLCRIVISYFLIFKLLGLKITKIDRIMAITVKTHKYLFI